MSQADEELAAYARSRVGKLLCGKYRIESVIGIGGMASVYAATHRNGRRVALKILHPELSIRGELRKRFLREGQAANAVKHPGAVVVIDDDVAEDGSAFLVMELLDGQCVEDLWLQNGQHLPKKMVLSIGRELCSVLDSAHRAGIVHRDIKPANLFLTRDGRLKVLDFGIARVRDAAGGNTTQTGMVFGTPAFMAPEQAAGRASQVDGRTDVWAAGATLFALLSGAVVHEGETQQHVVMLAATKPARSLASVMPDAEPSVVTIVDRALRFDKESRWPSADAMRTAICEASRALFGDPAPALTGMSDTVQVRRPFMRAGDEAGTLPAQEPGGSPRAVGSTTGEPVSSTATTKRKRPSAVGSTLVAVANVFRRAMALPTADASRTAPTRPRAARTGILALAGVAIGTLFGAILLREQLQVRDVRTPSQASVAAEELVPLEAPSTGVLGLEAGAANSATLPNVTTGAPRNAVVSPEAGAPPYRAPHRPAPHPATSVGRRRGTSCTPPYIVTPEGKQLWKEECL